MSGETKRASKQAIDSILFYFLFSFHPIVRDSLERPRGGAKGRESVVVGLIKVQVVRKYNRIRFRVHVKWETFECV